MNKEWRLFSLAVGFFTRVPMPSVPDFQESDLNHSVKYFPLVGLLVGVLAALVYWLAAKILPTEIAVILSMIATIYATGCFHEDGLADAADGLGGGWEKEQVLTIMQDSRIGSYGAAAMILALLAKFESLNHISPLLTPVVLIAGHALSRYAAVLVIYTQVYVRSSGKSKPLATKLSTAELVLASLFGLGPLVFLSLHLLWAVLPVALVWVWFSHKLKRRIGGYTGDCLGAMQQLTEIAFYLGILGSIGFQIWSVS
ncbi:MAG TPA: adenosylcobinamide-GDP ribazoletransferase [Methylophilaceae bacterium]|nr:adenosylcobinamide-GDP ribazoletransferase [Methylophilaceae bacterium]